MIFMCYLVVCINLLYSFVQAETFSRKNINWRLRKQELLSKINVENQYEYLAQKVSPYWKMTYAEQMNKKQNYCHVVANFLLNRSHGLKTLSSFRILPIVPSPITKAYRNADVFTILSGVDGDRKTVGFRLGKAALGFVYCIRPTKLIILKESHKRVAQVYEDFIHTTPLPPTLPNYEGGHWSALTVRSNEAGDVMASVRVETEGYTAKVVEGQQEKLQEYFYQHLPNITLFYQKCRTKNSTGIAKFNLLYGKPYLQETLKGYKFKIKPDSPFPNNKRAAELYYDTIIETAELKQNSTVIDLYSGSGAIGIIASKFVEKVYGIDWYQRGVLDANGNAKANNIHNVKFVLSKSDVKLRTLLKKLKAASDIVVIVSAGNSGPRIEAITDILKCSKITRIVYATSKIKSLNNTKNIIALCSTNGTESHPFSLTKIIPVDLLPQTEHVEIVLMLERSPFGHLSSEV